MLGELTMLGPPGLLGTPNPIAWILVQSSDRELFRQIRVGSLFGETFDPSSISPDANFT